MTSNRKRGRPPKATADKRRYRVVVKMNTREYYTLLYKARAAGLAKAECLRHCVSSARIVERLTVEELSLVRQLCGMANNLNQLAYHANREGYLQEGKHYKKLVDCIAKIVNVLGNVRKSNDKE